MTMLAFINMGSNKSLFIQKGSMRQKRPQAYFSGAPNAEQPSVLRHGGNRQPRTAVPESQVKSQKVIATVFRVPLSAVDQDMCRQKGNSEIWGRGPGLVTMRQPTIRLGRCKQSSAASGVAQAGRRSRRGKRHAPRRRNVLRTWSRHVRDSGVAPRAVQLPRSKCLMLSRGGNTTPLLHLLQTKGASRAFDGPLSLYRPLVWVLPI